ncbi:MAG: ornithine carbamoyltransferase [Candidatus Omnitrophica bacterium]|nr:ornithine carbamoyltransferase [Candidatus Omnitrophota bacterium]MCA9415079.1 ornithine carbamoyltransferase [Candidatus Omnitrophota bacterium]MCA9426576.1 ornithine carbamoyltransferase [Candidatus Omnitrophota bacterium]MCA9447184.1 ornithine carbamoyltransferase [Candidatus Omnitrophota bacterium]MCB9782777.1 ornithine carbamoyltransferase [Candidatus Omnitrophota bacterium]
MEGRDILSINDLSVKEASSLLMLAEDVKRNPKTYGTALAGEVMVLIFEKPSLRTRVTFETGMASLGGTGIYLAPDQVRMGEREPVRDVAKNLERWVQVIVARTFEHKTLEELALHGKTPVINALSDLEHPCQALADLLTIREHFESEKVTVSYVGDGNNVCHSLMLLGTMLGYEIHVASPVGYEPHADIIEQSQKYAVDSGGKLVLGSDPKELTRGAHVLYTDVWTSMGQEDEQRERLQAFEGFQVGSELLSLADPEAIVMHCLPAHRGEEISSEVVDGPRSVVFDQAENRLHAQKSLLLRILGGA